MFFTFFYFPSRFLLANTIIIRKLTSIERSSILATNWLEMFGMENDLKLCWSLKRIEFPIHAIWNFPVSTFNMFKKHELLLAQGLSDELTTKIMRKNMWNELFERIKMKYGGSVYHKSTNVSRKMNRKNVPLSTPESLHESQLLFLFFNPKKKKMSSLLAVNLAMKSEKHSPNGIFFSLK